MKDSTKVVVAVGIMGFLATGLSLIYKPKAKVASVGVVSPSSERQLEAGSVDSVVPSKQVPATVAPTSPSSHWRKCATLTLNLGLEDASLRIILKAPNGSDPLFGQKVTTMEAAECAARRWRLEGR